jgi:hypothetical protein
LKAIMKNPNLLRRLAVLCGLLLAGCFCLSGNAAAQTPVILAPLPQLQFFDQSGRPLAFGCVSTFANNSTSPLSTFTDSTGVTVNQNPVMLSAGGSANIWLEAGISYSIRVKSAGGLHCASGSTLYTINGIGGGVSTLSTIVPYSATPVFQDAAQNQMFFITLTGDASSQPLTAVGITPPGLITWQITQDAAGGHAFSWPANSIGGCTIGSAANQATLQHFVWNGSNAVAAGPCVTGNGPTISTGNIFDFGLSPTSVVCTDSNKQLTTGCGTASSVTYNGQTVAPGAAGNVNVGAAAHSVALNEGNGSPITGLTLGASQISVGVASADPVASTLPTCATGTVLTFTGTLPLTCAPSVAIQSEATVVLSSPVAVAASPSTSTVLTQTITMPATGCPCRAFGSYAINADTSASGEMSMAINDGTINFATGSMNTTGSTSNFAVAAGAYSTVTYANSASVTFTLKGTQTMGGSSNAHVANPGGIGQHSWFEIAVFTSN